MCGANGLSKIKKLRIDDKGIVSAPVNAFTKIIIWDIAVLNENDSMSSVTFLMVAWVSFRCVFSASICLLFPDNAQSAPWFSVMNKRHTRARKRDTPSTPRMLQGFIC